MRYLFKIALFSILLYLTLDVLIRGDVKGARPIVQAVGGLSVLLVSWYNLRNIHKTYAMHKIWSFVKLWRIFVVILVVYYLLTFLEIPSSIYNNSPRNIIIAIYIFSVVLFFYYGTINQHLTKGLLNLVLLIVLFNGLFEIYFAFLYARIKQGVEVINTSAGYMFVMILPILLYRFKKDNIWMFIITLILTMLTGKRGALLIYLVFLLYGFVNLKWIRKSFKLNWKIVLFLGVIIVGYIFFMETSFESLQYRLLNIENTDRGSIGSGRNILWTLFLSKWYFSDSLVNLFFGYGFYATMGFNGFMAHNDFVEFLFDFGLLGLFCYVFVLISYYKNIKWVKLMNPYLYMLLMFCLIIWLGRAFVAGTIRTDNIVLSMSLGYLFGITTIQRSKYV